jgi:hypothetical protein
MAMGSERPGAAFGIRLRSEHEYAHAASCRFIAAQQTAGFERGSQLSQMICRIVKPRAGILLRARRLAPRLHTKAGISVILVRLSG